MKKPVLTHYETVERYTMLLPDDSEVIVEKHDNSIACITHYEIRDSDTDEVIENHPYQDYVESYFEEME